MIKIVNILDAIEISKELKDEGKSIILAGGCFDILHGGHIEFLEKAKEKGDFLFILLESDETIRKIKGTDRPINTQTQRAKVLSALNIVDYIINIPCFKTDQEYTELVIQLKPDIIATTKGDPYRQQKEKQAVLINAKVIEVIEKVPNQSTSKLVKLLFGDL